ncbi:MAG: TatD family hydrolase [Candidatus Auribacterota bacterium]|nr:TatD family hydrolase [Candidatus Auribacterota bacterium]
MPYFDTHAHVASKQLREKLPDVLKSAHFAGVEKILSISADLQELRETQSLDVSKSRVEVSFSFGLHPYSAKQLSEISEKMLDDLFSRKEFISVGEVGLDYYRGIAPKEEQRKTFKYFLDYAASRNLPVCVHCRGAYEDVVKMLKTHSVDKSSVIMHCFSGTKNHALELEDMGCYISFAGNITFPKSEDIRSAAVSLKDTTILTETDCPYLSPQWKRGKINEPSNVAGITDYIAELRGENKTTFAERVYLNANKAFGLK